MGCIFGGWWLVTGQGERRCKGRRRAQPRVVDGEAQDKVTATVEGTQVGSHVSPTYPTHQCKKLDVHLGQIVLQPLKA